MADVPIERVLLAHSRIDLDYDCRDDNASSFR